jgi:hypothetical protein
MTVSGFQFSVFGGTRKIRSAKLSLAEVNIVPKQSLGTRNLAPDRTGAG